LNFCVKSNDEENLQCVVRKWLSTKQSSLFKMLKYENKNGTSL
jgi:hypothetical protein